MDGNGGNFPQKNPIRSKAIGIDIIRLHNFISHCLLIVIYPWL